MRSNKKHGLSNKYLVTTKSQFTNQNILCKFKLSVQSYIVQKKKNTCLSDTRVLCQWRTKPNPAMGFWKSSFPLTRD